MGYCNDISIIFVIGVLSLYGAEAQVTQFFGPVVGITPAGRVTTGVTGGVLVTTAAVTISENTVNSDGVIATVIADGSNGGPVQYTIPTASTIFEVHVVTGAITVSGTNTASVSGSPYIFVVEAIEDYMTWVTGTLTLAITVEGFPTNSPPTLPPTTSPPSLPPTPSPPTTCLLTGDPAASLTTLSTYSTSTESGETITYTVSDEAFREEKWKLEGYANFIFKVATITYRRKNRLSTLASVYITYFATQLTMLTQSSQDSWIQQQQLFKRMCYLGLMTARSPIQAQLLHLCLHGNYYPSLWHDWTPEK